ncbi:MAG: TlpA family protein disulfide reductase [Clostridia bacterium]|nr:TlpA family protein disulfide reductase [Clostridia bacterium]
MKQTILTLFLCFALLLSACGTAKTQESGPQTEKELLSSFVTKDLDGNIVDQEILKGKKLTVVNVWATFCGPCLREMPELEKLSKEMESRGVQVIGIVSDITDWNYQIQGRLLEQAKEIVSQTGVSFPSLIPCRDLAALCGAQSVPTTFFVDENGRQIGDAYVGARDFATWRALAENALEGIS